MSSAQRDVLLPLSILAGCGLIAVGLYAGLSARGGPAPVAAVATPSITAVPLEAPTAHASALTPALAEFDRVARANQDARQALERQRKLLLDKCWLPLMKAPGPKQSIYKYAITVDAAGNERARRIDTVPGMESREDVAKCLRELPGTEVKVTPPGREMTAAFELYFP